MIEVKMELYRKSTNSQLFLIEKHKIDDFSIKIVKKLEKKIKKRISMIYSEWEIVEIMFLTCLGR